MDPGTGASPGGGHCFIEYMYRDAANYKAHGRALVAGAFTPGLEDSIRACLIDGCYFVAEDAGLPTLQGQLARYSGGLTADDHDWHEFVSVRPAAPKEIGVLPVASTLEAVMVGLSRGNACITQTPSNP